MFKVIHFRGSDQILKKKKMLKEVQITLQYLDDVLAGSLYKRELFRQALDEMGWLQGNGDMKIFENRRYQFKGVRKRIALEGNFSSYENLLEAAMRLQLGFDKDKIDVGILILNAKRSENSPYGSSFDMVKEDIKMLEPTINLPISIALFDLEDPVITDGEGGEDHGVSVQEDDNQGTGIVPEESEENQSQSLQA
jgi:hypothetical protein